MEFSTLNGYKVKDKKATRFYDNVESMLNDTTLKDGMHVKTKGYYSVNDGGDSEYHITSTQDGTEYQEVLTNNLYATLVINNSVNVKQLGAKGDNETDDTDIFKEALSIALTKHVKLYIPNGRFIISDTLICQNYSGFITGDGQNYSRLIMSANKDLFQIKYGNCVIQNIGMIAPEDYTNALINFNNSVNMFTCLIENCGFSGNQSGTGIKIAPSNNVNIQNSSIKNCLFYKLENGIYIDTRNGYFNGNSIKDSWVTSCNYGILFEDTGTYGTSNLVIDNFKGQYTSGITTALIYNLKGSNNSVTDCLLWDGGKTLNISPYGKYTYVRNIGDLSLTKFENFGYRTYLEASDYRIPGGQYYTFEDNFVGRELSNIWSVEKSEGSTVSTDNETPGASGKQRPNLKISTGTTSNNYVQITLDNCLLRETGRWSMLFDLSISSLSNILVNIGGYTPVSTLYGNLISFDSSVNNKLRGISTHGGTIDYSIDLLSSIDTTDYIHCQITKDQNNDLYFWVNNNYIGKITPRNYSELPYIYVKTLDTTDKIVRIANLKIETYIA